MAKFRYRAKKGPEKIIESIMEASSKQEAVEKIIQLGYLPVKVEEDMERSAEKTAFNLPGLRQKVKSQRITLFSRQLAILLKSGVPILSCLNILAEQSEDYYFKRILSEIKEEVKNGKTLSAALSRYPDVFAYLYIALVKAGEDSGKLEEALLRIADYRRKQEEMVSNIRTALTYPALMGIVGMGTVIFMLVFVMPRLLKIFSRLGQSLPLPTKILIQISDFLRQGWFWIIVVIFGLMFLIKFGRRSKKERQALSAIKLHLPIFGNLILKSELARFSRTLELLLKSGIQLLKAIDICNPVLGNELIRQQLKIAYKNIEQGQTLGSTLRNAKLFPKFMVNLVSVGEESGRLEEALQELATSYELETDEGIKVLTTLLEPLLILVMGVVVGFIIIAMLLPVFQINMMLQ